MDLDCSEVGRKWRKALWKIYSCAGICKARCCICITEEIIFLIVTSSLLLQLCVTDFSPVHEMCTAILSSRVTEGTVQLLLGMSRNAYHCYAAFSNIEGQADSFAFSRDYCIDSKRLADKVEGRSKSGHPHIFSELLTKNPKCSCHTEFPKQLGIYECFKDSPCSVL